MSKKKILTLAMCVAMAAIMAVGTLAYFTDTDSADNVFTVGNVEIELTEPNWVAGDEEADDVYPGEALPKDPTVTNIGKNPCFIRVKVENLDQFVAKYGENAMITYETGFKTGVLGENWVDGEDGYFYYTKVVTYEGDDYNTDLAVKTTALFEQIRMPVELKGDEETKAIKVSAEAVQAQGASAKWSEVKSMGLDAIKAWFTTCMPVAE